MLTMKTKGLQSHNGKVYIIQKEYDERKKKKVIFSVFMEEIWILNKGKSLILFFSRSENQHGKSGAIAGLSVTIFG